MDDAPKSAMRVLNSMAVQAQFGKRKRGELAPSEDDGRKKKPVPAEGEGRKKKAKKVRLARWECLVPSAAGETAAPC
jgi:hypothetical protein